MVIAVMRKCLFHGVRSFLFALVGLLCSAVLCSTANAQWIDSLSPAKRNSILWSTDLESGDLSAWSRPKFRHAGSGIYNSPDATAAATRNTAHSGEWSVMANINGAKRGKQTRAVRLLAWTNKAWDNGGKFFPTKAYYSTWIYFPHNYDPRKQRDWGAGDSGWWNVFQFKGPDENNKSQPLWVLNVDVNEQIVNGEKRDSMVFRLYSSLNSPASYQQKAPLAIPIGKWVHVEAYYHAAMGKHGAITIYQDGRQILNATDVVTSLGGSEGDNPHVHWGIGNYTNHIDGDPAGEGKATIYFDDVVVSTVRISE